MSGFLEEVTAADQPVERTVTFPDGRSGSVWFRRITAAQKAEVLRGQRVQTTGGKATVDIDLGENETTKSKMVQFCVCHEDGKSFFKNLSEVLKLSSEKVDTLYRYVNEVNTVKVEAGES